MEIRSFLESISPERVDEFNKKNLIKEAIEHAEFLSAFRKGCCYICGMKLSYFNESEKCLHWFLLPEGIKKKHFMGYLSEKIGFFQLDIYLRWVANTDERIKNINDLKNEKQDGKLVETTIRYNNLEWSFNYGKTDLEGHKGSRNGNFPHFHLQILQDDSPFIRFNDCHIPFSEIDLLNLEMSKHKDRVEHLYLHGEGISVIENENAVRMILEKKVPCEDEEDATFHTRIIVEFPEGITEERFLELQKEAKDKGIPLSRHLKDVFPNIKMDSKVNPGKGVVAKKIRNPRKK